MENNYRNIGKIVSGFGLKGEMIVQHHLGKKLVPSRLKVVFLEQKKDELIPWFVETARKKTDNELYLKLEGIDKREAVSGLIRREVWLKETEVQAHTAKNNPIGWVGYRVIDQGRDLGEILEVIEQPHQVLCRLEIASREVLVPINEQTLDKIDHKTKSLLLTLPDGLLDVYLGSVKT